MCYILYLQGKITIAKSNFLQKLKYRFCQPSDMHVYGVSKNTDILLFFVYFVQISLHRDHICNIFLELLVMYTKLFQRFFFDDLH